MSDDLRIETLGHDSLAASQENLHSVEKSTVPDSSQNESQGLEMQGHTLEAVIPDPYHLPECPCAHQLEPSNHWHDHGAACDGCICERLRACEQRVLNRVRADERKRAVFIAQHSIEDSYCREDAIAWIDGVTPKWWTGNQP